MRHRSNIIKVIHRHVERVLAKDWWKCLTDHRHRKNRVWNFGYIFEVLLAGALSGCKTLREVETLSELYAQRIPDTTLHDILVRVDPQGLKAELARGVKQALREHELAKSEFPVRITAIDGKYNYNTDRVVNDCSEPIGGGGDDKMYRHIALRAMHVSSSTKLFLGQYEIESKRSETSSLIDFIDQLQTTYKRTELLEVISVDAGMVSKSNAQELVNRGLGYIMAVKDARRMLFITAQDVFKEVLPCITTEESYNGNQVMRQLTRAPAVSVPSWEHAQQFWKLQTVITNRSGAVVATEVRYFITSIAAVTLSDTQVLSAIRMHWGIENNGNWCFDVFWKEDSAPWTSRAMELVSYLRMMAYNIIERLKTRRLKARINRALAWKDMFRYFEHALCALRQLNQALGVALPVFV